MHDELGGKGRLFKSAATRGVGLGGIRPDSAGAARDVRSVRHAPFARRSGDRCALRSHDQVLHVPTRAREFPRRRARRGHRSGDRRGASTGARANREADRRDAAGRDAAEPFRAPLQARLGDLRACPVAPLSVLRAGERRVHRVEAPQRRLHDLVLQARARRHGVRVLDVAREPAHRGGEGDRPALHRDARRRGGRDEGPLPEPFERGARVEARRPRRTGGRGSVSRSLGDVARARRGALRGVGGDRRQDALERPARGRRERARRA